MNELITNIVNVCIVPILGILTTYVVKLVNSKIRALEDERTRNYLSSALAEVDAAVNAAVGKVAQVYVSSLKKDGKFNVTEQKTALLKAIDATTEMLSQGTLDFLNEQLTSEGFSQLLSSKIEALINSNKKECNSDDSK